LNHPEILASLYWLPSRCGSIQLTAARYASATSSISRRSGLFRVADFAALDPLDQAASGIARRTLARESALRRLDPIAAPVDEAPADPVGRSVRVNAAAATVASGAGAAGRGGDLDERLVERPRRFFGREPAGTPATGCVAPADLPSTTMEAGAHPYVHPVVADIAWTY
jgi:hypothetical protein